MIEVLVGSADQAAQIATVRTKLGNAAADSQANGLILIGHGVRFNRTPDLVCHPMSLVCGGVGEQNGELLATQPGGQIGCSERSAQGAGDMPERQVSGLVTMLIIDLFEMVQIQYQHG